MSKKIISVLLAVVMVLAMGTVALVSVSADLATLPEQPEGTKRYFFYMPDEWMNGYAYTAGIYWWEGTGAHSSWPGQEANKADVDGVYYCDVPEDVTTIVWNNFVDGGTDTTLEIYRAALQTKNIGTEYYDPGESDNYPDGTDTFDGMIYVTDFALTEKSDYSGKMTFAGEWCYYYGDGKYGFTPVEGDGEVFTDPAFNYDIPMPTDDGSGLETQPASSTDEPVATTTATEPGTTAPVPGTTADDAEPTTATAPAVKNTVALNNGEEYVVSNGDVLSYTVDLEAARLFENIQAIITYDSTMLKPVLVTSDDPDVEDYEVQGLDCCPNLDGVIFNAGVDGVVKFNASKVAGYNFKTKANLVTVKFEVIADGNTEIDLVIEEMTIKGGDESYFASGEQVITDGITVEQYITGNTEPTDPTTVPTTATTAPKATTTAPVEPGTTAPVPGTTADDAEPTTATVPAASSDATGVAGTTAAGTNGAVDTGAAAYLYVVLAVITMAACAVVVLRKRANG